MIQRFFGLQELGTNVRTEARAGVVTFMAMAYIIFVQPAILSDADGAGMDFNSVMMATCIASAVATFLMGLFARYPIALAPGMGTNVFFAYTVCAVSGMGIPWQQALGAVFIGGALFLVLALFGVREKVMDVVPGSLKVGIAVGIGLLIALVGLKTSGIIIPSEKLLVTLGDLSAPPVSLAVTTLALAAVLVVLRVRGAILISMLISLILGVVTKQIELPEGLRFWGPPPPMDKTFFKLDILGALRNWEMIGVIFIFFFLDLFDTVGTLIGVGMQANLMKEGRLPRARRALFSDAVGTVVGASLGTSTVTSYIESTAGISEGGRSGLANCFTGALFLVAIFFAPLAQMIGGGVSYMGQPYQPITGPILILIGSFMLGSVRRIDFNEPTEFIPAFLTIIIMPLAGISDGIAFGFISYGLLKLATRRFAEAHWLIYVLGGLFAARYVVAHALQ